MALFNFESGEQLIPTEVFDRINILDIRAVMNVDEGVDAMEARAEGSVGAVGMSAVNELIDTSQETFTPDHEIQASATPHSSEETPSAKDQEIIETVPVIDEPATTVNGRVLSIGEQRKIRDLAIARQAAEQVYRDIAMSQTVAGPAQPSNDEPHLYYEIDGEAA